MHIKEREFFAFSHLLSCVINLIFITIHEKVTTTLKFKDLDKIT